jgi:hypothetical protein
VGLDLLQLRLLVTAEEVEQCPEKQRRHFKTFLMGIFGGFFPPISHVVALPECLDGGEINLVDLVLYQHGEHIGAAAPRALHALAVLLTGLLQQLHHFAR